ncbi:MAG: hypothetical protein NTW76_05400 [Corynebacteriales bacterium]|nr:hypothetical protein [Mycobacteriales bacterium]
MSRALAVDGTRHRDEIERFSRFVVKGPRASDCWIWVGAIADDGYGRFWVGRPGGPAVVRAHRYAYALAHGRIGGDEVGEHQVCDNPVCVKATAGRDTHILAGGHAENMASMGRKGRGGGGRLRGWGRLDKAGRAARSRALRAAVVDGWDAAAVTRALGRPVVGSGETPLFEFDEIAADVRGDGHSSRL